MILKSYYFSIQRSPEVLVCKYNRRFKGSLMFSKKKKAFIKMRVSTVASEEQYGKEK